MRSVAAAVRACAPLCPSGALRAWGRFAREYLNDIAWRPGTCEGLLVGDATSNMGLIVRFEL